MSSLRRAATISGHGSAEGPELLPALQRRASSPSVSAPGLEGFGMYRASGLLLPLNLSYMPKSLSKYVWLTVLRVLVVTGLLPNLLQVLTSEHACHALVHFVWTVVCL